MIRRFGIHLGSMLEQFRAERSGWVRYCSAKKRGKGVRWEKAGLTGHDALRQDRRKLNACDEVHRQAVSLGSQDCTVSTGNSTDNNVEERQSGK